MRSPSTPVTRPSPPSKARKTVELGGTTSCGANAKAPKVMALFKTSLPAHKGKTKVVIAVLPQGDTSMVTIRQP